MDVNDAETIRKAVQEVFKELGPHHNEKVYQNALRVELGDPTVQTEETHPVFYKGNWVGSVRLDLTWKNYVIEVKALKQLFAKDYGQCYRYARCMQRRVILVNFAPEKPLVEFFEP